MQEPVSHVPSRRPRNHSPLTLIDGTGCQIWFLPLVALMFVATQIAALSTTHVDHLWIVSTMLGLSYGSLFNVLPMLVLEWFGMSE